AVILFKAVVLTLAIGLALAGPWRSERSVAIVGCFLPAVICITGRGFERPEMLSLLGLATWLFVLYRSDRQPGLVWLLPVVQVLWVNCHSLFVLAWWWAGVPCSISPAGCCWEDAGASRG
ncbi:MAG: hypothetical protein ACK5F7_12040, partial [Planctomycetaceae bacterium]